MIDTLIKVDNVSKKFCRSFKRSLWYGLQDLGNELIGRRRGGDRGLRKDEFWAIKNVSFELKRGECLGVIGHNGAGKTTLLRMLNGLIKPDAGCIELKGRVGALIALGAGFNPIQSGRENIYVNASVLGLTKHEVDNKIDEVIEFAEIGEFIDAPIQSYSSGMVVRLGFAVAVSLTPDILILDEVLAVGDMQFQRKCLEKVYQLIKDSNRAVLIVGHNIRQIQRVATKVMLLNHGQVVAVGDPEETTNVYYHMMDEIARSRRTTVPNGIMQTHGGIAILQANLVDLQGHVVDSIVAGTDAIVRLLFSVAKAVKNVEIAVSIQTLDQIFIVTESSGRNNLLCLIPGQYELKVVFYKLPILPGEYCVGIYFNGDLGSNIFINETTFRFGVTTADVNRCNLSTRSLIHVQSRWEVKRVE